MSISLALQNSLSGLIVSQAALGVISQNVANANTVGYSRKEITLAEQNIGGIGSGVVVEGIDRVVDQFLLRELQAQRSALGAAKAVETFAANVQARFGTLANNTSLSARLSAFTSALDTLAINPEDPALRFNVVSTGQTLARGISGLAESLQKLRAEADAEIKAAVDSINLQLGIISKLNTKISQGVASGASIADLEDRRDRAIGALADDIGITTFVRESGELSILSTDGKTLLDGQLRELDYTPAATVTSATAFGAISIFSIDTVSGEKTGNGDDLVTAGTSATVTTGLTSGRLKGLLEVRDARLNNLAAQLDSLANTVRDQYNAIHNTGSSFPAPNSLTGTRAVATADAFTATGTVRIAVVNASGAIVGTPVDLDLTALGATTVGGLAAAIDAALGADGAAAVVNGKLKLTAANAANGIAIHPNDTQVTGTTQDFSRFFGLNDFFTGAASTDFAIRADIAADPSLVATGELSLTATSGQTGIAIGDNRVVQRLAALSETSLSYAAVGGLPAGTYTIGDYAGAILGLNAVQAASAELTATVEQDLFDNLDFRASSVSGVNVNEEMANLIVFQNAFAASARVLATASKMFDMLLEITA